jgi:hypothetical protein
MRWPCFAEVDFVKTSFCVNALGSGYIKVAAGSLLARLMRFTKIPRWRMSY